jgi:serine phosphatase RsbU (regulator of sigma subunit)/anti-sigma regulatory factor (Ser/Thr protein kinase)
MNAHNHVTLPRLLARRETTTLLNACAQPDRAYAIVLPDEKIFANTANWSNAHAARAYELIANGKVIGTLLAQGNASDSEHTLHQSLNLLIAQALEKREVANEALERYREINLMYRVSETIGASLDAQAIPQLVLDESKRVINARVGLVVINEGEAISKKACYGSEDHVAALLGAGHELIRTARAAIVSEQLESPVYCAILWAPFQVQDHLLGGVLLGRMPGDDMFTASDEKLLTALARQAAIALENTHLHQVELERERMRRELQLAYDVQASLIPRTVPKLEGWDFAAYWQPAREVSGDFYDFFAVPQGQAIAIADVSDKGMHAALFMALTRSTLRASMLAANSPADAIMQTNRLLCADSTGGMFVTLFYAQIEPARNAIAYVNAGHNPPIIYRAREHRLDTLSRTGVMLGFDESMPFDQNTVTLDQGDVIVLYTDGVTESMNAQHDQFTEERLENVILAHHGLSPKEMLNAIRREVSAFVADAPQFDDITMVIAKRLPDPHRLVIANAAVDDVPRLRDWVESECIAANASDDMAFAIKLSVEEACTNIVTHGYHSQPGAIQVQFAANAERIVLTITDHAPPFEPTKIPRPDLDADWHDRKIGGLGWFLISELMDTVRYSPDATNGNTLELIKHYIAKK